MGLQQQEVPQQVEAGETEEVMTKEHYLICLEEVLRGICDSRTQIGFLRSLVDQMPINEQRGTRSFFADAERNLNDCVNTLLEQKDWVESYCPTEGEQPGYEDV